MGCLLASPAGVARPQAFTRALILVSDFLSIPVRDHSSEVESGEEAKSIRSKTSG